MSKNCLIISPVIRPLPGKLSPALFRVISRSFFSVLLGLFLVACDGDPRPLQEAVESSDLQLASLTITPNRTVTTPVFLNTGQTLQFRLSGRNTAGQAVAVSAADRRWTTSDGNVGSVNRFGLFQAVGDGPVDVGVRVGGVFAPVYSMTVSDASLTGISTITGNTSVSHCSENSYDTLGSYSDGSQRDLEDIVWSLPGSLESGTAKILQAGNAGLVVGAIAPGSYTVRAASEGLSTELQVTVNADLASLTIQPDAVSLERGQTRALSATAIREDAAEVSVTRVVNWRLSQTDFATVSNTANTHGSVTGISVGTGVITAVCGDIQTTADISVVEPTAINSLELDPDDSPITLRLLTRTLDIDVYALTASGGRILVNDQASWRITDGSSFVEVDSSGTDRGTVTALAVGTATLEVSYRNIEEEVTINVTN